MRNKARIELCKETEKTGQHTIWREEKCLPMKENIFFLGSETA